MNLTTYKPVSVDITDFIDFWSVRYTGYDDNFYMANIGKDLSETRILDLFTWKNGTPLSENKKNSVMKNFVARKDELNGLAQGTTASQFLERFTEGGAIWRIFWLHCWQPKRFPIYDQHVYRAMRYILEGVIKEIPNNNPLKIKTYIDNYLPFYERFANLHHREVDKALWTFGKSLKGDLIVNRK